MGPPYHYIITTDEPLGPDAKIRLNAVETSRAPTGFSTTTETLRELWDAANQMARAGESGGSAETRRPHWDELESRQQEEYAEAVNSWIASEVGKRYRPDDKTVADDKLKRMTMADTFIWDMAQSRYPGMPTWTTTPAPQVTVFPRGASAEVDALINEGATSLITVRFPDGSVATGQSYPHPDGYDYQLWEQQCLGQTVKATTIW